MNLLKPLLTAALLLTLAACGDSSTNAPTSGPSVKPGEKVKIGFIVKLPNDPWFQNEWKFARQAAAADNFELKEIGLTDGSSTLAAIDSLAAQGVQGFIVCSPEPKIGQAILDRAARSGMKVMSVDDRLESADGKPLESVPHMGITARDIGKKVGETLLAEYKKRNWPQPDTAACILTHDSAGPTQSDRTNGEADALTAGGFDPARIYKIAQKDDPTLATGRDAMNALVAQHPEIKNWLIAGVNDGSVVGAVRATEALTIPADRVAAVGIGVDSSLTDLSQPKMTGFIATVLISPRRHGYDTADLMYHWIKDGTEPPKTTWTQGVLIDRANYQQVMKEQGLAQ
ncbi:MAG TPA: substrate-binding domain-containing protein [Phycisphaerae bacterium]|nr:substrate-binding domain-containing protein [Phycisphaerae bacterium]